MCVSVRVSVCVRLLAETVKIANDDEWTKALGDQLSQQLELYKYVRILLICLLCGCECVCLYV